MNIDTNENIKTTESLTNHKVWLGKSKSFPSIKVSPPQQQSSLSINVSETVGSSDKLV